MSACHRLSPTPECGHYEAARARVEEEQKRLTGIINNLLDNITPANREFVDERLTELTEQRRQCEMRLEELDHLAASQAEIKVITDDALKFLTGLDYTLRNELPQEKLTAFRQCIERIHVDGAARAATVAARNAPCGNLGATQHIAVPVASPDLSRSATAVGAGAAAE